MRLTLENFRCYSGIHTFTFKDSGVTLLSGPSGAGKSTLLMAIDFVLFGRGRKLATDGLNACRVTWESCIGGNDVRITRTKRPNRLLVETDTTLQDEEAQCWIERVYGKRFDITGYIQQQSLKNFIYLAPQDKLAVLEDLIFKDHDPASLKKRIVELVRDLQVQMARLEGQITVLQAQCADPLVEPTPVDPPADLAAAQADLRRAEKAAHESTVHHAIQTRVAELRNELELLQSNPPEDCPWTLEELRQHDQQLRLQTDLQTRVRPVWEKESREEIEDLIHVYTEDIALLKEYDRLTAQRHTLEKIQTTLEEQQRERAALEAMCEGTFTCPECDASLVLKNSGLHPCTDDDLFLDAEEKKKRMRLLTKSITALLEEVSPLAGIRDRMTAIEEAVDVSESVPGLEKELTWMHAYLRANMQLEAQQFEIQQQLGRIILLELTLGEWTQCMAQHEALRSFRQKLRDVETRLNVETQKLERMSNLNPTDDVDALRRKVDALVAHTQAYTVYTYQREAYAAYVKLCSELNHLKAEWAKTKTRVKACHDLRELVLKTEVNVLTCRLRELTALINVFLEEVFTEPIHVSLSMLKASKTVGEKVHISLELFYKNMHCEFQDLSGGEQARVNIAFVLAFAHHFHSPLLLLDECTSNLDMMTTSLVVDHIQQSTTHKILLVAHDIVEGVCAEVVNI
jgi:DNA repair exonuclease SbcCD ATPase subunit